MENGEKITKMQIWERKLLDFSLRNMLLSFRVTKNAVQIMTAGLGVLEDALSGGKDFRVLPVPDDYSPVMGDKKMFNADNDREMINRLVADEFEGHRIRTFLTAAELETNLKSLQRASKVSMEENGSNTLYLAIGFLKWYETDKPDEEPRYAPLVLLPVDIVRNMHTKEFVIRSRREDTQINITLLEYLRQIAGIDIAGLDPLPEDESGVDLSKTFTVITQGIACRQRWSIENMAFIGLFSFGQFVMWNDMRNRAEELQQNKVVKSLIEGRMVWEPEPSEISAESLDRLISPEDMALPMSADSSQMIAVALAADGASFVLHGPPGTGKSQTITNIIADSLYHGRTVLFAAEKMAALEVVQKRLASIGLDPFCLELHSNKTNKSTVLQHLEKTLEMGRIKAPAEYAAEAGRLHDIRDSLNYIIEAVHGKRSFGISLYEAAERYEAVKEFRGKIEIPQSVLEIATGGLIDEWEGMLREYQVAMRDAGNIAEHPLRGLGVSSCSMELKEELSKELTSLSDYCGEAAKAQQQMLVWSGIDNKDFPSDRISTLVLINMCEAAVNPAPVDERLVRAQEDYARIKEQTAAWINDIRTQRKLEAELSEEYIDPVFRLDAGGLLIQWKTAETEWVLTRSIKQNAMIKQLRIYAKDPESVTAGNMSGRLAKLSEYASLTERISGAGPAADPDALEAVLAKADVIRNLLSYVPAQLKDTVLAAVKDKKPDEAAVNANETAKAFITSLDEFKKKYSADLTAKEIAPEWICGVKAVLDGYKANISCLRSWAVFNQKDEALRGSSLSAVSDAVRCGRLNDTDLEKAFRCGLYYGLIMQTVSADDRLKDFRGRQFEDMTARYRELDEKFRELTVQELAAKLSSNIPVPGTEAAASSELGILKKAIKSNGRMMPVRRLFSQTPTLLGKLCPCMLMSPISVAQYIDPSYPKFDLVIFDEASQLPTSEAVGTIARGENTVIVGDPKQLPPTSFFKSNRVDEDNIEEEDMESLLDDCLAISMPQEYLKWHYRSRHESLIAYSNMKYYDNKLFTFPSPNDLISEVNLVHVDGRYEKGGSKQNRAEAEAVVSEVMRRLQDDTLKNDSIGVVTFSQIQQDLIDDLLTAEFEKFPEIADADAASKEPVFIKNLENVQGDERDAILFSIGYGPDEDGNVSMNFGPLNQDGGWRRLNVAITRARKQMTVYSSLKPSQIDLSKTGSAGVAGLKGFLEFAERGQNVIEGQSAQIPEDAIVDEVAAFIRTAGYDARTNVGCSQYRMDIGVVDPDNKDTYILGILLDGENCYSSSTARDRFIVQPGVLNGLGWNLFRVWVLDWLNDQDNVKAAIKAAAESALADAGRKDNTVR